MRSLGAAGSSVMAAKLQSGHPATGSRRAGRQRGANASFSTSPGSTCFAAQIGRILELQYQQTLREPLPDALAALVCRLQDREANPESAAQSDPGLTPPRPV